MYERAWVKRERERGRMRKYEYPYVCIPIHKCTSVCVHEWNGREVWAIAHCYNTNIILNMPNSHHTVLNIESN